MIPWAVGVALAAETVPTDGLASLVQPSFLTQTAQPAKARMSGVRARPGK